MLTAMYAIYATETVQKHQKNGLHITRKVSLKKNFMIIRFRYPFPVNTSGAIYYTCKFLLYYVQHLRRVSNVVAWPSGLRRWFKAPVSSEAWVRIPPLPRFFYLYKNLFIFSAVCLYQMIYSY